MFNELLTDVDNFLDRLTQGAASAGYRLYLVGGTVRDGLLGRPTRDLDLTTDAPVPVIKEMLDSAGADAIYGLGEKFGTLVALVGDFKVEVTTFRSQEEVAASSDALAPLHTDLSHRDFTVNAVARDLHTGTLHDPHSGQLDITHRIIRAVGSPEDRFREDPLRLLRAVRLAVELGFFIERETKEAIRSLAYLLDNVSRERVGDELDRLLVTERPGDAVDMLDNLGLLPYTVPEVIEMHEMERGPHHYKEVYPHTLKVVDRTEPDLVLRWAALLHDIAKPRTYGVTDGEVHFFGHERVGARMARDILARLKRTQAMVDLVVQLVAEHLRIGVYDASWSDGAVRRFLRETAPVTERLFALSRADITSQRPQRVAAALARVEALYERCQEIKAQEDVEKLASPLNGDELMAIFGGKPGRWIGQVKDYLLGLVLDGELGKEDKEGAELLARQFLAEQGISTPGVG
ncbi:MAG TPA: HD domain-containing protein [Chloroflexia bacterium]|nr:HD domain-containing protein [Chloroflexia bacterium]